MLKILGIFILISIAATAGYVLKDYDFMLSGQFGSYLIEISAVFLAVIFLFFLLFFYLFLRFVWWIKTSPSRMAARLKQDKENKGYKEIIQGFSALAASDFDKAQKFADQAKKHLPKQPLVQFLQAQTAYLSGNKTEALEFYKQLSQTEEAKFIGYRGIIASAIENKQPAQAMLTAEELLKTSPKSKWLNEAIIDLAFRSANWEKAERFIKKAEANRAISKKSLSERFAVFYYMRAKIARADKRFEDAIWLLEKSLKYDDKFVPSAVLLSSIFILNGEFKKCRNLVESFWKICPHPNLGADYERAIAEYKESKKLDLITKLHNKNATDFDSILFYARAIINFGKSNEAKEVLLKASKFKETRVLCAIMAQIDDNKLWLTRKDVAGDDKCWYCTKTGARYLEWQPYSNGGEFNTIIWGFPPKVSESASTASNLSII